MRHIKTKLRAKMPPTEKPSTGQLFEREDVKDWSWMVGILTHALAANMGFWLCYWLSR